MDTVAATVCNADVSNVNELQLFLETWDKNYNKKINQIDLFKQELTNSWNNEQKQIFVKLLYHQRAHFGQVLWNLGNFAPNYTARELILENIRDEFGKHGISHEKLYLDFAKQMGVDLTYELIEEKFYPSFLREYNNGHLRWLLEHDWDHNLSAFAALERLDNVDYVNLLNVAKTLGATKRDLVFFNVHIHVTHFDNIEKSSFGDLWKEKPDIVKNCFNFIGNYQIDIWKKISDAVFLQQNKIFA